MPTTLEGVVRSALVEVGAESSILLGEQWANELYNELASRTYLRHLRRIETLHLADPVTVGTVSVTKGSHTVTPNGTALAEWKQISMNSGEWWIRVGTGPWYRVDSFDGAAIRLSTPYMGSTASGSGYRLRLLAVAIPGSLRHIFSVQAIDPPRVLQPISLHEMLQIAPQPVEGGQPQAYAHWNTMLDGTRTLTFYPLPREACVLNLVGYAYPPPLRLPDALPPDLDADVLRVGILLHAYRYEMHRRVQAGDFNGAAVLRNEMRTLQTDWERAINTIARNNALFDDGIMLYNPHGITVGHNPDIVAARDHVWR